MKFATRLLPLPFILVLCFGQDRFQEVRLTKFGAEEGIEQLAFKSLLRDQQGFLWFGSQFGLVRFDGNQFKTYLHDDDDPASLSNDYVYGLAKGPGNLLTIFTSTSVDIYDPRTENFHQSPLTEFMPLHNFRTVGSSLWFSSKLGISVSEPDGTVSLVLPSTELSRFSFFEDTPTGDLVVKTAQGFLLLDTLRRSLHPIVELDALDLTQVSEFGVSMHTNSLLFGVPNRGLMRFGLSSRKLEVIPDFRDKLILNVLTQKRNSWIQCSDGLYHLDENSLQATQLVNDNYSQALLSVSAIHEDENGLIWLGSYNQGLFLYDSASAKLAHFHRNDRNKHLFTNDLIQAICPDRAGTLWLGSAAGIFSLERDQTNLKNRTEHILPDSSATNILQLFFDKQDRLWGLSLPATIFRHDFLSGQTSYFQDYFLPDPLGFGSILLRENGQLWLGTEATGTSYGYLDNLDSEAPKHFPVGDQAGEIGPRTFYMLEDSQQRLWIGTLRGLFQYQDDLNTFRNFSKATHGLSNDLVTTIFEDSRLRLWVGSAHGLNLMQDDGSFRAYTKKDGLIDDTIYAILQDSAGYLWLSTNKGLARFDPEKEQFKILGLESGIQGNEFNINAAALLADGFMAFGGVNGFNVFDPRTVFASEFPTPATVITDFLLSNQQLAIDPQGPLRQALPFAEEIQLGHQERVFGFEFAAPGARVFKSTRYSYMLEGFDASWQFPPQGRHFATYTNLKPGAYRLRVKSANQSGDFGEEATLSIRLDSHPLRSFTAYLFYVVSLLVIIAAFLLNQRHQRKTLKRLVKQRTALLASKNAELRATDSIVSTINKVLQPDEVLHSLTREVHHHFPGADLVSYILIDPITHIISISAACGEGAEKQADFTDPAIRQQQRLFQKALKRVAEGVFIAHDFAAHGTLPLLGPNPPASLICLEIRIDEQTDGYLAIANLRDPESFRDMAVETLSRVRQHAISALAKARNITELVTAQKALIENAHASGMAELAMEVMHNIGTQTNNAKTSAQLIMEKSDRMDDSSSLTRLAQMMDQGTQVDPHQIVTYLRRLSTRQAAAFVDLRREMERLDFHLQEITRDLYAQQKHTGGTTSSQSMDLNQVLEEVLHTDRYLLKMDQITVVRAFELKTKIRASPTQLKRVITYVLGNAQQAMVARPESHITVATGQDADFGYFMLRDNGVGIEPEFLEAVFRPGFSSYSDKRGFGLHYCANSLKEMSGKISIHSDGLDQGTEVRCYLPLSKTSDQ